MSKKLGEKDGRIDTACYSKLLTRRKGQALWSRKSLLMVCSYVMPWEDGLLDCGTKGEA